MSTNCASCTVCSTSHAVLTVCLLAVGILHRTVNVWNSLPSSVYFSTLNAFKRSIVYVDFFVFIKFLLVRF